MSLKCLHEVLQVAMGWKSCHLHQFEKDGVSYGDRADDEFDQDGVAEDSISTNQLLNTAGDMLVYLYDFGDNWRHELILENIILPRRVTAGSLCLDGQCCCPPEDVGGPEKYDMLLKIMDDRYHPEYAQTRKWLGGSFDADEFDIVAINKELARRRLHP
jgi:hypothetical protein